MVIGIDVRPLIGNGVSGVEIYTKELLLQLFQQFPKTTFVLYCNAAKEQTHLYQTFNQPNITIVHTRLPNKILNLSFSWFRWPKIDKTIAKKTDLRPDAFFFPDLRPAPMSKNCKKIMVVHDLSYHHFPHYFSFRSRLWYKLLNPKKELSQSDHIIAVSNFTKQDLVKTYRLDPKKITTIHEGISEEFGSKKSQHDITSKYNLPSKYFLFLATLEPRKNIKNLLKAFSTFSKKNNNDIKLVLAGKPNSKIFATVPQNEKNNIQFIGFVDEEDKPELYAHAEAFIYPSLFEGFGLPLLEAMKVGTPIITSNTSSMPEVVGDAAILINPLEPQKIAQAMEQILEPQLKKTLRQKMDHQIKKFSWEKCARATAKLLSLSE